MVGANSAAQQFWLQLRALYEAAGRPTLQRLVRLGLEQQPPIMISYSTINDWLNCKAVPTGRKNERYLTVMIAFLQGQAKPEKGYKRLSPGEWGRLLRAAQEERAEGRKKGRPQGQPKPSHDTQLREFSPRGPLIGRDGELAMLAGLVKGIAARQGGTVLIEGEPGIGKSTLMQAAAAQAVSLGCQVYWGTGSELDAALPLLPVLDALRVRAPSPSPRREAIARLLRGETMMDRGTDGPAVLAEQLLALVAEECAARPTVLVIDDLQWADQATIVLLGRLARSAPELPLLLAGMSRPTQQRDDLRKLRRAQNGATRIELVPLADPAVAELVAELSGGTPDTPLLDIARGAGGNPLYVTEIVAAMRRSELLSIREDGTIRLAAGSAARSLPLSLTAAIIDRLSFVPVPLREMLRMAALLGVEFAVEDLATVLGTSLLDLFPAMDEARAAGLLAECAGGLAFRHPLIQQALYDEAPVPVRIALHADVSRKLAAAGAPAAHVARQLLRAISAPGTGGPVGPHAISVPSLEEWMLDWLADAADLLINQAPQVAAELLASAVASTPVSSDRYGWLASRYADALYRLGERSRAEQVAGHALELGDGMPPDLLVDLHWTMAQCRMLAGRSAESLTELERALGSPGLSARHRARLLVLKARTYIHKGELDVGDAAAVAALETAEETHDTWAAGWAMNALILTAISRGKLGEALVLDDRALAATQADPALADLRLLLLINRAAMLGSLDRYEEALAVAGEACRLARQAGTTFRLSQAQCTLSQAYFETGRWDDALREMAIVPESLKEPATASCEHGIAAVIGFHRGQVEDARQCLASAIPHKTKIGQRLIPPLALARSLDREQDGDPTAALCELTTWFNGGSEELGQSEELLADAVRLAMRAGDLATAENLAKHAAKLAGSGSKIPHRQANALYCAGLAEHDAAKLAAAAQRYADASKPLQRAMALEAAGAEYGSCGDHDQARAALDGAAGIYAQLGATVDVARVTVGSCSPWASP